jgi:hypothetical protein
MASFGMVYSGAPLFMWVHAVKTAEFVNNITATFYAHQQVWATPYEVIHGESFPDASVVVPFGCAALILLDAAEQSKFQSRCTLMLFMHYADCHPLFTYAFYSPKTKRIVYRQDCIFLPTVFPMRTARSQAGLHPDGESLVTYRSPPVMRDGPPEVSFKDWTEADPLPSFDDDVTGFELFSDGCFPESPPVLRDADHPSQCPDHPAFAPSFVQIPAPTIPGGSTDIILQAGVVPEPSLPRRSSRRKDFPSSTIVPAGAPPRKRVRDRWSYELVPPTDRALISHSVAMFPSVSISDSSASPPVCVASIGASSSASSSAPHSAVAVFAPDSSRGSDGGAGGARTYVPLLYPGHTGQSFDIQLSYPDGEHVTHLYTVFHGLPVSGLRYNISCLLRVDSPVFLFVGPSWAALDHRGTITDRCFPGTSQPCPFLVDGSSVRVRRTRFSSPTSGSSVLSSNLIDGVAPHLDLGLGGTMPPSDLLPSVVPALGASRSPLVNDGSSSDIFQSVVPVLSASLSPLVNTAFSSVSLPQNSTFLGLADVRGLVQVPHQRLAVRVR